MGHLKQALVLSQPNGIFLCIPASSSFGVRGPASTPALTPAPALALAACSQAQAGRNSRLQHNASDSPAPVRYVNYLAYEGYSVEIIGGKHFKTPDGEFVEIKSGTQYKIHVKNSRAYGKGTISCVMLKGALNCKLVLQPVKRK